MSKFIEVVDTYGKRVLLDVNHISTVEERYPDSIFDRMCIIYRGKALLSEVKTKEKFEDVRSKIDVAMEWMKEYNTNQFKITEQRKD